MLPPPNFHMGNESAFTFQADNQLLFNKTSIIRIPILPTAQSIQDRYVNKYVHRIQPNSA